MSNEELVEVIRSGAPERMDELWEQVEGLVKWKARRIMTALELRGDMCGVAFDDLVQCAYPAMVAAVESYRPENGAFSTWFVFFLKNAFSDATGYRTKRGQEEPLNNSLSLDKPLSDEADAATFGEMIPDAKATATMEGIEERLWREQLHRTLEAVLSELPKDQCMILRHRYYNGQSVTETGQALGIPTEQVRKLESEGLRALRQPRVAKKIRQF